MATTAQSQPARRRFVEITWKSAKNPFRASNFSVLVNAKFVFRRVRFAGCSDRKRPKNVKISRWLH
jgi:hypothetical protein